MIESRGAEGWAPGRERQIVTVARNVSTTLYGNVTTISESPLQEGVLITGTNDGRISVTEDGGATWRSIDRRTGSASTWSAARSAGESSALRVVSKSYTNEVIGASPPS